MRDMITQEDEMGCGATCVAFVADTTYAQVVSVLGRRRPGRLVSSLKNW